MKSEIRFKNHTSSSSTRVIVNCNDYSFIPPTSFTNWSFHRPVGVCFQLLQSFVGIARRPKIYLLYGRKDSLRALVLRLPRKLDSIGVELLNKSSFLAQKYGQRPIRTEIKRGSRALWRPNCSNFCGALPKFQDAAVRFWCCIQSASTVQCTGQRVRHTWTCIASDRRALRKTVSSLSAVRTHCLTHENRLVRRCHSASAKLQRIFCCTNCS